MNTTPSQIEELAAKLGKLAHQQADVNADPSYDGKRMLLHTDTMYWAARTAILTLTARNRELEELVKEMEPELRGMIYEQYKGTLHYSDQQRRYKRDLEICDRAAALSPPVEMKEEGH